MFFSFMIHISVIISFDFIFTLYLLFFLSLLLYRILSTFNIINTFLIKFLTLVLILLLNTCSLSFINFLVLIYHLKCNVISSSRPLEIIMDPSEKKGREKFRRPLILDRLSRAALISLEIA